MRRVFCRSPPLHCITLRWDQAIEEIISVPTPPRKHEKMKAFRCCLFSSPSPVYLLGSRTPRRETLTSSTGGACPSLRRAVAAPAATRVGLQHRMQSAAAAAVDAVASIPFPCARGNGMEWTCFTCVKGVFNARHAACVRARETKRPQRQGRGGQDTKEENEVKAMNEKQVRLG